MTPQIISFNCVLKNKAGSTINSTYSHDVLTAVIDEKAVLLGLSRGLDGLVKGETRTIELGAADAYGLHDPAKIILFPRRKLKNIRVGEMVSIVGKSGTIRTYKVVEVQSDMVRLDQNHPLAGQDLVFEIEALAARPATTQEVAAASNNMSKQNLH